MACVMICAMLLPMISLPVEASGTRSGSTSPDLGSVNESLPFWVSTWRELSARLEAWSTPYRAVNVSYSNEVGGEKFRRNKGDDRKKREPIDDMDVASARPQPPGSSGNLLNAAKTSPTAASAKPATDPRRAVSSILNQLPPDEHDSVYTAQNNLGMPRGQTEIDSTNSPATLPIQHRVGSANFSFGLTLAYLSGRGINAGVGLTFNSRTWNKSCAHYGTNGCDLNHFTYDVERSWVAPGFSSGFGYLESVAYQTSAEYDLYKVYPLGLTDADGGRHQLTCAAWSGSACTGFRSSDGTFIRTSGDVPISGLSGYANAQFTVTYPNGTKMWYAGAFGSGTNRRHYPVVIQDNNGNRIRIEYKSDQSGRIDNVTDTLNRKIKFYYENDANGNPDKLVAVTIPGIDANEELQTVRFYYQTLALSSAGKFIGDITAPASIRVLQYIYLPATKTGFKYDYDTNYGVMRKITRLAGMTVDSTSTTSTGAVTGDGVTAATTEYNYPDGTTALADVPKYTQRSDDWAGKNGSGPEITLYDSPDPVPGQETTSSITVADNGFDVITKNVSDPNGMLRETSVSKYASTRNFVMAKNMYTWSSDRNLTKLETTNDAGLTKATEFEYDQYNNQTKVKEYDYAAAGSLGTLLRTTETVYQTGSGWTSANLLGLPVSVKTIIGGTTVSKTLIEYDHNGNDSTLTRRADIDTQTHDTFYNPDHPAWDEVVCPYGPDYEPNSPPNGCVTIHHPGYSAASAYRGNVTKTTAFSDATLTTDPSANVTAYDYDIAGNLVSATLSCCNLKTIDYGNQFSYTGYAFPLSETKGSSPTQLTSSATYNWNTGLVLTSTDANGRVTSYEYETDTLRPKKTTYPNGGYIMTEYSDKLVSGSDLLPGFIRQTNSLDASHTAQSYSYFDGRGSALRSAAQTPDGWSISAVDYDSLGRPQRSYNPFYGSTPTAPIPTGTKHTEVTGIDALGRTTGVKLQDNTTVSTYFSTETDIPGGFNKTYVTVTDQAGKQRRQVMDVLGRIVRVDEPDSSGSLGAVDASLPAQQTYYDFDGNDNLTKVTQSDGTTTQERKFKYDSLSRLVAEKQVEASPTLDLDGTHGTPDTNKWTKVLKYSANGLLTDGYDARGVHTQMGYDGLNRVTGVTYSDGTPAVTYTYDQSRSGYFNAGALTRVETAAMGDTPATATEFDYDQMGRTVKHRQWIAGQEYDLEYTYNLAGQLVSEKYPSGRVVTNTFDANGRLSGVGDASRTYLSDLQYQQYGGALSAMTFGNGTVQTFAMNDRLQMTGQELKRGSETLQRYDYGYGQIDGAGNLDTTKNNGQLGRIQSYIGAAKQWTQKFSHDSIGRLSEAKEYRGDTDALTYKQHFDFDRFGNLYRKAANNGATGQENPLPYTPIEEDADISKSTNRFTTDTTYDEAGDVTADNKFRTMGFAYDANGRMVKATRENTPDALSVYDAAGMRVAERVNDVWRFLIYDIGGKLIAEYGGPQSTDEGGVKYVLSDWQGSTRCVVSNGGFVRSRTDYTAFGEEIGAGTGLRTAAQGFGISNTIRQKYGLTERDDATGLDHTWFRKHENQAGRWTGPDPYGGSMSIGDPQSFNRYAYVGNDPANFVDPSGLNMTAPSTRYGPYDPFGIAYYLDGMLSDAWTVWSVLGAGAGYIIASDVPGLTVINSWEQRRNPRSESWEYRNFSQIIHFFTNQAFQGDGEEPLPNCAKRAILEYYKSVGNSSNDRLNRVQAALIALTTSAFGFPVSTPPGLARKFGGAQDVAAYTSSGVRIYFDIGRRDFTTAGGMALLIHEFTHVMQYREMPHFPQTYISEWAKHGAGEANRYERRGYVNQRQSQAFFEKKPDLLCK